MSQSEPAEKFSAKGLSGYFAICPNPVERQQ